jgi:hypothetical protein
MMIGKKLENGSVFTVCYPDDRPSRIFKKVEKDIFCVLVRRGDSLVSEFQNVTAFPGIEEELKDLDTMTVTRINISPNGSRYFS